MLKLLNAVKAFLANEPVVAAGLLQVAVVVLAKFGFHATPDQLMIWAGTGLAIVTALVRHFVTPTARVFEL